MDQIVFEGNHALVNSLPGGPGKRAYFQGKQTVEAVTRSIGKHGVTVLPWSIGLAPVGLPLRAVFSRNGRYVFLVECAPGLYTMPWIQERRWSGGGYLDVQIAVPYTEFFITTTHQGALQTSSVYFRTSPLGRADYGDDLLDSHFLNCSVNAYGVYCWICFVNMRCQPQPGESLLEFVGACVNYFWVAPFNRSSERNEGQSFFRKGCGVGTSATQVRDERVWSIEAWERASADDPAFALSVPWTRAGRTVMDVFLELTGGRENRWPFQTAGDVGNLILAPEKESNQ